MKHHLSRSLALAAALLLPFTACVTDSHSGKEWTVLFDGSSTDHWRNYRADGLSDGWKIVDGALTRAAGGAGDIVTKEQYGAFELVLEYKISKGGNSGIMFHVTEEAGAPWHTGPEIQVQDNVDAHDPQLSGWLYQLYKPTVDATKPVGEWNKVRVLMTPEKSAVWMNGVHYYDFVKGSDDWNERVAASKFKEFANFGKPTRGHICLQDHGDEVAYRNIKIRSLD